MVETREIPLVNPQSATFIVERHGVFALGAEFDGKHIFMHVGVAAL